MLSFENLAVYDDVIDQETARFIENIAKAKKVGTTLINEYIVRTLHRIAYGMKFPVNAHLRNGFGGQNTKDRFHISKES